MHISAFLSVIKFHCKPTTPNVLDPVPV